MTEAMRLTEALGGTWFRTYGTAPCPVCQKEGRKDQTALTLSDGFSGLLANCKKSNCSFFEILKAAGVTPMRRNFDQLPRPAANQITRIQANKKSRYARQLWDQSAPATGTPAEAYLRDNRMITAQLPDGLRFNPSTWHGPSRQYLPAMIARIDGGPGFSVNRTYLMPEGSGKAALPKGQQKMILGPSAGGGHVLLRHGSGRLVFAEGIESALSLASGLVDPDATIWASLTAGNLRSGQLPALPGHLIIATDGDHVGREAGAALSGRAAGLGWKVEILEAPDGMDWNDVLIAESRSKNSPQEFHHGL